MTDAALEVPSHDDAEGVLGLATVSFGLRLPSTVNNDVFVMGGSAVANVSGIITGDGARRADMNVSSCFGAIDPLCQWVRDVSAAWFPADDEARVRL